MSTTAPKAKSRSEVKSADAGARSNAGTIEKNDVMSLKKLFVIVMAVVFGTTAALVVAILAWSQWNGRPKARDATALTATFEQALIEKSDADPRLLQFRYVLRNKANRDLEIRDADAVLYIQRDDGALVDLKEITDFKLGDIKVPAGDKVIYLLNPKLHYDTQKNCNVRPVEDPKKEQLAEYMSTCYKWVKGFVLLSGSNNLRVDMPFDWTRRANGEQSEPKSK